MKAVLLEAIVVAIIGMALAFSANQFSPRGLALGRNYSPGSAVAAVRAGANTQPPDGGSSTQLLERQLATEGLQLADSHRTLQLFQDSTREQGLVIFVDARNDEHYEAGHIPGAFQLDHYHPEKYLGLVLPACQAAQKIVVYCKGGSCEDSEQTALFLRDAGVPKERLFVYAGGFDEWQAKHRPVELGERNSGRMESAGASTQGGGAE